MKRISAYQATDGTLFDDKKACAIYQAALNVAQGLKEIGNRIDRSLSLPTDDRGNAVVRDGDSFAEFVMKHAEDIKAALAGKPIGSVEAVTTEQPTTSDEINAS